MCFYVLTSILGSRQSRVGEEEEEGESGGEEEREKEEEEECEERIG